MDLIKRRALIGWIAGLVVLGGLFLWASIARPSMEGASAALISRIGIVSLAAFLPVFLGARAVAKFTPDNAVAAVVLPVFVAAMLAVLVIAFGFIPEGARMCNLLARYETIAPDPACFTPQSTRLKLLAEGYFMWVVFGLIVLVSFRLRERAERRRLEAIRA